MDFVFDPLVNAPSNTSSETLTPAKDEATVQELDRLERGVENAYNMVLKATLSWGSSFLGLLTNIQLPKLIAETQKKLESMTVGAVTEGKKRVNELTEIGGQQISTISKTLEVDERPKKMLDILKSATNSYLDDLDHELEQVESFSLEYATKVRSFIQKNVLDPEQPDNLLDANKGDLDEHEAAVLFNVPDENTRIYATRTEAQLHTLHTLQDLYLTDAADAGYAAFSVDLDEKTEEIASLLKKHKSLQTLMSQLVPARVSYEEFWKRYYYMYGQIVAQEEKRRRLAEGADGEDEFDWDDSDDEDEGKAKEKEKVVESRTSSELTYDLKSRNSSTLDVVASKRAEKDKKAEETKAEGIKAETANVGGGGGDDDDDDDWE